MDETLDEGSDWSTESPGNTSTADPPLPGGEIDTVIVIIWAIGGALLVTLIILMVCILRSHQKSRRDRRSLPQGRGNQRQGGVNQGFSTNYDEIWTWIPVVTDSQARCPSQINPFARGNSSLQQTAASSQQRSLLNNLRLPSYNEAVRINTQQSSNTNTNQNRTNQILHHNNRGHVTTGRSAATAVVPNRPGTRTRAQPSAPQISATSLTRSPEHHYETIPHDRVITSRTTNHPSSTQNVTSVNVTSSSGAPIHHATTSRVNVDHVTRSRNSRLPPVLSAQSLGLGGRDGVQTDSRIVSGNVGGRSESRTVRAATSNIYPIMDNVSTRPGFQHSSYSAFMYCGNQRVSSNIPPPGPGVYEVPTLQVRGVHPAAGNQSSCALEEPGTSLAQSTRDALRHLESEYF